MFISGVKESVEFSLVCPKMSVDVLIRFCGAPQLCVGKPSTGRFLSNREENLRDCWISSMCALSHMCTLSHVCISLLLDQFHVCPVTHMHFPFTGSVPCSVTLLRIIMRFSSDDPDSVSRRAVRNVSCLDFLLSHVPVLSNYKSASGSVILTCLER